MSPIRCSTHLRQGFILLGVCLSLSGIPLAAQTPPPATPPSNSSEAVAKASDALDASDYKQARELIESALVTLKGDYDAGKQGSNELLARAYDYHARAVFDRERETAKADFRAALRVSPSYQTTSRAPKVKALFEEVRNTTVGVLRVRLTPPDARLEINGKAIAVTTDDIPIVADEYTLTASRRGFRSQTLVVTIPPGETDHATLMALERYTATLALVTVPTGVMVSVDGVSQGNTTAAVQPDQQSQDWAQQNKVEPSDLSAPLIIDIAQGRHELEFTKDCFVSKKADLAIDQLADKFYPVKLDAAVGTVRVTTTEPDVTVFIDAARRGPAPYLTERECEGDHSLELRSPRGRFFTSFVMKAGREIVVKQAPKPAVALLAVNDPLPGLAGVNLREKVAAQLAETPGLTFFAPPKKDVDAVLAEPGQVGVGWLSFDEDLKPLTNQAKLESSFIRQQGLAVGKKLGTGVQGVAELRMLPDAGPNTYIVSLLASGSGVPDVIRLELGDTDSDQLNEVYRRLGREVRLFKPSLGISVVDVLDSAGPVIVDIEPGSDAAAGTLKPGDTVTQLAGQPVKDAASFLALLNQQPVNSRVALEVTNRTHAGGKAAIIVKGAPLVIGVDDRTVLSNKAVIDLRDRLASRPTPDEANVLHLNLAVGLMRVKDYEAALEELDQVHLPDGVGVAQGTVNYLRARTLEALRRSADAAAAYKQAAQSPAARIFDGGALVSDLAKRRLEQLQRSAGASSTP